MMFPRDGALASIELDLGSGFLCGGMAGLDRLHRGAAGLNSLHRGRAGFGTRVVFLVRFPVVPVVELILVGNHQNLLHEFPVLGFSLT